MAICLAKRVRTHPTESCKNAHRRLSQRRSDRLVIPQDALVQKPDQMHIQQGCSTSAQEAQEASQGPHHSKTTVHEEHLRGTSDGWIPSGND